MEGLGRRRHPRGPVEHTVNELFQIVSGILVFEELLEHGCIKLRVHLLAEVAYKGVVKGRRVA